MATGCWACASATVAADAGSLVGSAPDRPQATPAEVPRLRHHQHERRPGRYADLVELGIEFFYPSDPETDTLLHRLANG